MGNRTAADADALLAGRGPGAGGGAGTPGAAAALAGGVLLIGAVLAGNSLVCVSVAAERSLQTPTNYFIVSLAAADLLLALLVLPLFVYSEVSPRPPPRAPLSCSFIPCPTSPQGQRAPATWLLRNLKLGVCRGAAPGLRTTGASVSPNSTPPHLTVHLSALLSVCLHSLFCPSPLCSLSVLASATQEMPLSFKAQTPETGDFDSPVASPPPQLGSDPQGSQLDRQADSG